MIKQDPILESSFYLLLSLSLMFSQFIQAFACLCYIFMAMYYSIAWMAHAFF